MIDLGLWETETAEEAAARRRRELAYALQAEPDPAQDVFAGARQQARDYASLSDAITQTPNPFAQARAALEAAWPAWQRGGYQPPAPRYDTAPPPEDYGGLMADSRTGGVPTAPVFAPPRPPASPPPALDQYGFPLGARETTRALGQTTLPVPDVAPAPPPLGPLNATAGLEGARQPGPVDAVQAVPGAVAAGIGWLQDRSAASQASFDAQSVSLMEALAGRPLTAEEIEETIQSGRLANALAGAGTGGLRGMGATAGIGRAGSGAPAPWQRAAAAEQAGGLTGTRTPALREAIREGDALRAAGPDAGAGASTLPSVWAGTLSVPGVAAQLAEATPAARSALAVANDVWGTVARLNLLSSPLTHLRNVAGNAAVLPWSAAEAAVAPALEPLARGALRKAPDPRYAGEAPQLVRGYAESVLAGARHALDVLRHGDEGLQGSVTGQAVPAAARTGLERVLDVGFRPLSATDAFFTTMAEGGALRRGAYRQARQQGLTGAALEREVAGLLADPPPALVEQAHAAGQYATYRQALDSGGAALERLGRVPVVGPLLLPFVRTPYNAVKYDLERSPLGVVRIGTGATSGEAADRAARALLGSTVAAGLFAYALDGGITAGLPATPSERDAWEQEGKRPWSIKIGDSWWDVRVLPGLGGSLALAAGLADAVRRGGDPSDAGFGRRAARLSAEVADTLVQRPLLDNVAQLVGAIGNPATAPAFFERMAGQGAALALPGSSALRYATGIADPLQREPRGVEERVAAGIPGLSGAVPGRRTAFGEELPRPAGLGTIDTPLGPLNVEAAVNPFRRSPERPGIRRYVGSADAAEDAEIAAALARVQRWRARPNEYPAPTTAEVELSQRFRGRENPQYARLRAAEAARLRRERLPGAGGAGGGGGGGGQPALAPRPRPGLPLAYAIP